MFKNTTYIKNNYMVDENLENNLSKLKSVLGKSSDVIFKAFEFNAQCSVKAFTCGIDSLIDKTKIEDYINKIFIIDKYPISSDPKKDKDDILKNIEENLYGSNKIEQEKSMNKIIDSILSGNAVLFIDGYDAAFVMCVEALKERAISEPYTEMAIRGSRVGFIENIGVNISLLRRVLKSPNLIFENMIIGNETHTKIAIAYMDGYVNENILENLRTKLNNIDIDAVLESGYIEQYIDDNPKSLFPTVGNSEKPDKVASKLLEGRIAIFCDGTPFVLTVPCLFIEAFQASEDYYSRPFIASTIRIIRVIAFIVTLTIPSLYVALTTFHQEMINPVLLISFASAREGVPFPAFIEATLMLIVFELIRESGIRMPKPVGQAVSIVGALVLGQAAVEAGIIGAPMVIIVALTGISSFIVTPLTEAVIIIRFLFLLLSGIFGLFGFMIILFVIIAHMCSLESFGIPYLKPIISSSNINELKDTIIRMPLWQMHKSSNNITNNKRGKK